MIIYIVATSQIITFNELKNLFLSLKKSSAKGKLYIDDAVSFNYKKSKEFIYREFNFENSQLKSM